MRVRLPDRRLSITERVHWWTPYGESRRVLASYGFDGDGRIREVFIASFRADSSLIALCNDACIVLSRLLQCGEDIADVAQSLSEDREEGRAEGPPASIIGAIAREGAALQCQMAGTGEVDR